MSDLDVAVPDLGNFDEVAVVDVLVKAGDKVEVDTPLVTLETEKATMDVPSSAAGTVSAVLVKAGDKVRKGSVIAKLTGAASPAAAAPQATAAPAAKATAAAPTHAAAPASLPVAAAATAAHAPAPLAAPRMPAGPAPDRTVQLLVLGGGPGGYTAAFRAADLGMQVVVIERWETLGGVCLNVGCIPSKALLHAAKVIDEARAMSGHGVSFGAPAIDLDKLRDWKNSVIRKLTGGLGGLAKTRKVEVVRGVGRFVGSRVVEVTGVDGSTSLIGFEQCIIAAGSEPVKLPFIPEDPRIIDSTGALELKGVPRRMLVIGGGIIGLEMACVYEALGAKVSVVELGDQLMPGADLDLVKPLEKRLKARYEKIMLGTKSTKVEALPEGIRVTFETKSGETSTDVYDRVLVAVGRVPNGRLLNAEAAGVTVNDRGFIPVDKQMRTDVPGIFAIGDIVGQPMLAHKATHEAKVAAEVAAGHKAFFDARAIPSVAYTDPEVAWVGVTEGQAKREGLEIRKAAFPWAASGRSLSIGRDEGFTKLIVDARTSRVIGGGIVGPNAGELIAEVGLAIEMGADTADVGLTIHPHPTLSESVGMTAEALEGTLTDLYMPKKG
ncbi:MAG: dihydrolipoyl dehydrogenase [Gammaproteobacteria bacterium]|nr:dihydrolipoyl dehydrogenase [Gammaproteobacteria bacterium]